MNNISQRDAFWNRVYERAKDDKDIVVISADMGAPTLDKLRRDLPSQFINVGIAEQNALNLAAGLSLMKKKVFTYAIAPFITLRCLEQIRVENAIMNIPITIVGVGVGFGYEDSGPTHHLIEDVAIMRAMPNITINSVTDNVMAEYLAEQCCKSKTATNYIRLLRQGGPDIYSKGTNFSKGSSILKESKENYIISTGSMIPIALDIVNRLNKKGNKLGLIDLHTLPINESELLRIIKNIKKIVTLEEHFLPGGIGSAIYEVLYDRGIFLPIKRIGIPIDKGYDHCYEYGGRDIIRNHYGISKKIVERKIENFISS